MPANITAPRIDRKSAAIALTVYDKYACPCPQEIISITYAQCLEIIEMKYAVSVSCN